MPVFLHCLGEIVTGCSYSQLQSFKFCLRVRCAQAVSFSEHHYIFFFIAKGLNDMQRTHGPDVAVDALDVACHSCSCQQVPLCQDPSAVGHHKIGLSHSLHSSTFLSQNTSWYLYRIPEPLCTRFKYVYKNSEMYVSH